MDGPTFARIRERLHLTQEQLAAVFSASRSTIARIERKGANGFESYALLAFCELKNQGYVWYRETGNDPRQMELL